MAPQNPPFTAFTGTNAPDTASLNSMIASLMAGTSQLVSSPASVAATNTANTESIRPSSTALVENTSSSARPVTFATAPSSSIVSMTSISASPSATDNHPSPLSGVATSTATATATATATNIANNSDGGISKSSNCNSISCSPGLQAAVAVPVVIGVLAVIALNIFLIRRRRKTAQAQPVTDEKPKKTWARHLRIFSFDNELVGGRFSSNNSLHNGQSPNRGAHHPHTRDSTSLRSMEEVAPPYGAALNHAQHPDMSQAAGGLVAGGLTETMIPRSTSRATAPPPYASAESRPQTSSTARTTNGANPFSDTNQSNAPGPVSPFQDPSEDGRSINSRPVISRTSSLRTGDEVSSMGGSEEGSIREAQIIRHISVSSDRPRITHIRNSSQISPPNSSQGSPPRSP